MSAPRDRAADRVQSAQRRAQELADRLDRLRHGEVVSPRDVAGAEDADQAAVNDDAGAREDEES